MSYSLLQNGSDIRGIALENETGEKVNLTDKAACDIAAAFTRILTEKTGKKNLRIAIGRDSRLTGEALLNASAKGIASEGGIAFDLGIASTPAMFMSTVLGDEPYDGSIMITASHLPWYRNGMKFFIKRGGLEKNEIKEIAALADTLAGDNKEKGDYPAPGKASFMDTYTGYLRDKIINGAGKGDKPLAGLHVVVDAGNGAV